LNYLPTGCPASIPEPAARKTAMEKARLRLWDRILIAQEQVAAINHEIDLCDMEINEARAMEELNIRAEVYNR
jgi:hypothetical protein